MQSISSIFVVLRHDGPSNSPPFLCSSVCPSMMDMHALPCLPVTAAGTSLTLNFPVAFCCSIGHAGTMNGDSPANGQHLIFIWILPLPISRLISASDVSSYTMFQPSVVGDRNTRAFQQCRNRDRRGKDPFTVPGPDQGGTRASRFPAGREQFCVDALVDRSGGFVGTCLSFVGRDSTSSCVTITKYSRYCRR